MNNFELAWNSNTPPETLDRLANNESCDVRYWVARNPNTSPETLDLLANDEDLFIRLRVALNPKTPQYLKDYFKIKDFLTYHE